jgi:predicted O-methyltransferase YrrM
VGASSSARDLRRSAWRRAPALRRLPPRVALFQLRAHALALRLGDEFALSAAARPGQLAELLRLARGRRRIAELGTATGWTTASLALAAPAAHVLSADPVVQPHRERYLALAPASARARIELVRATGAAAAAGAGDDPVDLLFIDSSHERDATIEEHRAWGPRLAPSAVVVLHDYGHPGFPGVEEAVVALGLRGRVVDGMFVAGG